MGAWGGMNLLSQAPIRATSNMGDQAVLVARNIQHFDEHILVVDDALIGNRLVAGIRPDRYRFIADRYQAAIVAIESGLHAIGWRERISDADMSEWRAQVLPAGQEVIGFQCLNARIATWREAVFRCRVLVGDALSPVVAHCHLAALADIDRGEVVVAIFAWVDWLSGFFPCLSTIGRAAQDNVVFAKAIVLPGG